MKHLSQLFIEDCSHIFQKWSWIFIGIEITKFYKKFKNEKANANTHHLPDSPAGSNPNPNHHPLNSQNLQTHQDQDGHRH